MKYNHVDNLPLDMSEIGFGLWTVATKNWNLRNSSNHVKLLNDAFALGINFFDTADSYGQGYGERILSEAFDMIRQEIIISTKLGYDFYSPRLLPDSPIEKNFQPNYIRFACEQSLKRLNTDYVDIFSIHYPELSTAENDSVFEVLERLIEEGKILSYGAAIDDSEKSFEISEILLKDRNVNLLQVPLSCVERDFYLEGSLAEFQNVLLVRRVHGFGFLDGTSNPLDFQVSNKSDESMDSIVLDKITKAQLRSNKFVSFSEKMGYDPSQLAVVGILDEPLVLSALPNIFNSTQLELYCAAVDKIELSDEIRDGIHDLY